MKTLTRIEAAAALNRTTRSVAHMINDGRLISTLVNGERRISAASIQAVLSRELHTAITGENKLRGWRPGRKRGPRVRQPITGVASIG